MNASTVHRYNALLPSSFATPECVAQEGDRLLSSMMADVRAAMASTPLDIVLATRQRKRIVSLRMRRWHTRVSPRHVDVHAPPNRVGIPDPPRVNGR
jgi:hypothetical protein